MSQNVLQICFLTLQKFTSNASFAAKAHGNCKEPQNCQCAEKAKTFAQKKIKT